MTEVVVSPAFAVGDVLPEYRVRAHNAATHSDNKIHDDDVAKQYGFAGGLVPGVTVYAYMTRPVVDAFGLAWVERGTMSGRFLKPFYEGEEVTVRATVTRADTVGVALDLVATNPAGETCAIGAASLTTGEPAPVDMTAFADASLPSPVPPASEAALRARPQLGSLHQTWDAGTPAAHFLEEIADDHALWTGGDAVAHPGYLIREANNVLARNVRLGPWIHVSSETQHHGAVRHGDQLSTQANVLDVFERKGHRFVTLDVLVAARNRPILRTTHTAIYEPRRIEAS